MKLFFKKGQAVSNGTITKREEKKRINIAWNSGVFFQLGLLVSLLLVFVVVNSDLGVFSISKIDDQTINYIEEPLLQKYIVEVIPEKKEVVKITEKPKATPKPKESPILKIVTNLSKEIETKTATTEVEPDAPIVTEVKPTVAKTTTLEKKNILSVENAPIFPGCESLVTNSERKACLDQKINAFIGKQFNIEKFADKYVGENNTVSVQFTVDTNGEIVDILTRSKHSDLGEEAKRVIAKLPTLIPGKHNNTNVQEVYTIPIILNVKN